MYGIRAYRRCQAWRRLTFADSKSNKVSPGLLSAIRILLLSVLLVAWVADVNVEASISDCPN